MYHHDLINPLFIRTDTCSEISSLSFLAAWTDTHGEAMGVTFGRDERMRWRKGASYLWLLVFLDPLLLSPFETLTWFQYFVCESFSLSVWPPSNSFRLSPPRPSLCFWPVITLIFTINISAEVFVLSGTYQCMIGYEGDVLILDSMTWNCMGDPCTVLRGLDCCKELPWTATTLNKRNSWGLFQGVNKNSRGLLCELPYSF